MSSSLIHNFFSNSHQHRGLADNPKPMAETQIKFDEYRAPKQNHGRLIEPGDFCQLAANNAELIEREYASLPFRFCGASAQMIREATRAYAFSAAKQHSLAYLPETAKSIWEDNAVPNRIVSAGHQPTLFHPGVWFKNFLIDKLAKESTGAPTVAINLVVDHDDCAPVRITAPVFSDADSRVRNVPVVAHSPDSFPEGSRSWENWHATVDDEWTSFPQRVRETVGKTSESVNDHSLVIDQMWPVVLERLDAGWSVGTALAAGRHFVEFQNGCRTLELPYSQLANQSGFQLFLCQIAFDIERFHNVFHESRQIYRDYHKIRSQTHPVPTLSRKEHWWECPFWVYSDTQPTRLPLYADPQDSSLVLSDLNGWQVEITDVKNPAAVQQQFAELVASGICFRSRALMTSMFARLFLGDVFVHGIGGAKYDQLTDMIIERWIGWKPPEFCVATASVYHSSSTEHRPWLEELRSIEDPHRTEAELRRKLNELRFHPEKYLSADEQADSDVAELLSRKKQLLMDIPPRGQKKTWHDEITRINTALHQCLRECELEILKQIEGMATIQKQWKMAKSREYSIATFPAETLSNQLRDLTRCNKLQ